ncbi:MAG: DUF4190 domain-containing protein [Arenimonas sp.]
MTDQPTLPPAPPAPTTAGRQTNALALVSLISGILGWTLVPWLGSIVAVVTGHMARAELRRNPDTQEGDGFAVAGLVLGWSVLALTILGVLILVLIILFFGTAALAAIGPGGLH